MRSARSTSSSALWARRLAGGLLLSLLLAGVVAPLATPPQDADRFIESILDDRYQIALETTTTLPWTIQLPEWVGAPLRLIPWLLLGLLLLLLLRYFLGRLGGIAMDEEVENVADPASPRWAEDGLRRADELAAEGRYEAALHGLLLTAVEELMRRGGLRIADALTSREILRDLPLPPRSEEPLGDLVRSVEWSHFGGRPCGEPDYHSGREQFVRLQALLTGGGA